MGVGEDPVGEDGMDIDAPAWPPADVEAADEGVIRKGDPGDFYMKVIAKKFRGVLHYGVITGVITEWVLEDYGGATQWRDVFEDGDIVDLLRSEVVEAMAAAQEHPPVDADGDARLVTVHEGDDLSSESRTLPGVRSTQPGWRRSSRTLAAMACAMCMWSWAMSAWSTSSPSRRSTCFFLAWEGTSGGNLSPCRATLDSEL